MACLLKWVTEESPCYHRTESDMEMCLTCGWNDIVHEERVKILKAKGPRALAPTETMELMGLTILGDYDA